MRRMTAIFACLLLASAAVNADPVVQIIAVDRMAHENGDLPEWGIETRQTRSRKAAFQVWRSGPAMMPLKVNYLVGGTASNGVDYVALSGRVTIPAGQLFARIIVHPIDDRAAEWRRVGSNVILSEAVNLTLRPSKAYRVGPRQAASVYIRDHLPTYTGGHISISVGLDPFPSPFTNSVPILINPVSQP